MKSQGMTEALRQWRSRRVMPTGLSSVELRALGREVTERAVFSARATCAVFVQEIADVVDDILDGQVNHATGRWQLFKKLKELGYDPEVGFPDAVGAVPPAARGSLRDLSSMRRLDLMIETNEAMAANYGRMVSGNEPYARYAWPAWELKRVYHREVPRGTPESHSVGWQRRWFDAGQSVDWQGAARTVFVALKDSPIWQALGDGVGGYEDTLGNPYPPFAFRSGMDWRTVRRERCKELGLIDGEEAPEEMGGRLSPDDQEVNDVIEALSPDMRDALLRELKEAYERTH